MNTKTLSNLTSAAARSLLALLFLGAGLGKISGYEGTQGYMESMGVAGELLPLVILLQIGGGLALLTGIGARLSAAALAGFSLVAAFIFHLDFADPMQQVLFMKNLAIAGGLSLVALHGPGDWSLNRLFGARTATAH